MTTEQQLQAIIEAQVRGSYYSWELLLDWPITDKAIEWRPSPVEPCERYPIIEILLDPAGIKAAYGEHEQTVGSVYKTELVPNYAEWVAREIAATWFHSNANLEETVGLAYRLLP